MRKVLNDIVYKNLELLYDITKHPSKKDISALVNRATGEIAVEKSPIRKGDWKPIKIHITKESCELYSNRSDMESTAYRIILQTNSSSRWMHIDRHQAEELLRGRPVGTYLIRKDEFATMLEHQLHSSIKCFTLSFLEAKDKVTDFTLVKKKEGWLVYRGDPRLNEPIYPTLSQLLLNIKERLDKPLILS